MRIGVYRSGKGTYARRPGNLSTESGESFDEDGGLDGPRESGKEDGWNKMG